MNLDNLKQHSDILIITDQLPYPPRNGVTLPVYNYAVGLLKSNTVTICLLWNAQSEIDQKSFNDNEKIFGKIDVLYVKQASKFQRVVNEVSGQSIYYHGWFAADKVASVVNSTVDVVIVSPISAVAKYRALELNSRLIAKTTIAATNDCMTAEFYTRHLHQSNSIKAYLKGHFDLLRHFNVSRIEKRMLSDFNHVLLQTNTDRKFMLDLVSKEIAEKVTVVPNGVSEVIYQIIPKPKRQILFIAELSQEYSEIALWLLTKIWPEVSKADKECRLVVVGKGASNTLKTLMNSGNRIDHIEFVDDLATVYSESMVALSPVFKGFGLINKTVEAMAAFVPVVGGIAAFNGVEGFKNGRHGIACVTRNSDEFIKAIVDLLNNDNLRKEIAQEARSLAQKEFKWENAINKILTLISRDF